MLNFCICLNFLNSNKKELTNAVNTLTNIMYQEIILNTIHLTQKSAFIYVFMAFS